MNLLCQRIVLLLALLASLLSGAAQVVVVDVPSESMDKMVKCSVLLPDGYDASGVRRYPVVYMLHGAGNDYRSFADAVGQKGVDDWGFIGVCPDGDATSWWWDSPVDPKSRYETFVAKDLVLWMDRHYLTMARKDKRAIVGASMGGHGACWLGFRHRDVFGAIGNIYGGVDIRPFPTAWEMHGRLGCYSDNPERWRQYCCVTEAAKLRNGDVNLITFVGTDDFFLQVNRQMHEILSKNKVEHVYVEIRGESGDLSSHTHPFRRMVEPLIFRYFHNYFAEGKAHL